MYFLLHTWDKLRLRDRLKSHKHIPDLINPKTNQHLLLSTVFWNLLWKKKKQTEREIKRYNEFFYHSSFSRLILSKKGYMTAIPYSQTLMGLPGLIPRQLFPAAETSDSYQMFKSGQIFSTPLWEHYWVKRKRKRRTKDKCLFLLHFNKWITVNVILYQLKGSSHTHRDTHLEKSL